MWIRLQICLLAGVAALALAGEAAAEQLRLTNGQIVRGEVIRRKQNSLVIRAEDGRTIELPYSRIAGASIPSPAAPQPAAAPQPPPDQPLLPLGATGYEDILQRAQQAADEVERRRLLMQQEVEAAEGYGTTGAPWGDAGAYAPGEASAPAPNAASRAQGANTPAQQEAENEEEAWWESDVEKMRDETEKSLERKPAWSERKRRSR